jgi:hypothetical protein
MRSWVCLLLVFGACKVVCVGSGEKYPCIPGTSYQAYCPSGPGITIVDATYDGPPRDGDDITCNVITQTGCNSDQKCSWIYTGLLDAQVGRIGCIPSGDGAAGQSCAFHYVMYDANTAVSYDDCAKGDQCVDGVCQPICDATVGSPSSCDARHACALVDGVFEHHGHYAAGTCHAVCDPLADNDLLGSGTRGSGCGSSEGCFGGPVDYAPNVFVCAAEAHPQLVHRSACGSDCTSIVNHGGCAQGYLPLLRDTTGSTQVDCVALCRPGNAYLGNPGAQEPAGQAPHRCVASDARGTFAATEHCMYSWRLEIDGNGFHASPTDDSVGICVDHAAYGWPDCAGLGLGSAAEFGCVDSVTAGSDLPTTALDIRSPGT